MSSHTSFNTVSQNLSDKNKAIVENIELWVMNANFEQRYDGESFKLCVDTQISEKWNILKIMNSVRKI